MDSENVAKVKFPRGIWIDGIRHQIALLRPLNGEDEAFLLDFDRMAPPAVMTTKLLARCLSRLGPFSPVTPEAVRDLVVGDREALLLHLRRLTLGNRIQCIVNCTNPACKEKMDLDLNVSDLLVPSYDIKDPVHQITLDHDGAKFLICIRLPTGRDQEAMIDLASTDQETAASQLIDRCILSITKNDQNRISFNALPKNLLDQVSSVMSDLDPQAEITLKHSCPSCGAVFSALFDAASFILDEMTVFSRNLYREVHWLALNYHWSEAEILSLTTRKRRMYLDFIEEETKRVIK